MRTLLKTLSVLSAVMVMMPAPVQASHASPLARAACAYRDAVVHFGHEVIADHRLTRFERRVAPPLVDAATRFHVLAQRPHHAHLLSNAWFEIERMHRQVELVLFNHPGCPVYVTLRPCWQEVLCAYRDLALELTRLGCQIHRHDHGHHFPAPNYYPGSHRGSLLPSLPLAAQQSYRYREAAVPSYRYGTYSHGLVPPESKPVPNHIPNHVPSHVPNLNPRIQTPTLPKTNYQMPRIRMGQVHSPSQTQSLAAERDIIRGVNQRQLDRSKIGASLSRRLK